MPEAIEISPSILAADFARLGEALQQAEAGGAGATARLLVLSPIPAVDRRP